MSDTEVQNVHETHDSPQSTLTHVNKSELLFRFEENWKPSERPVFDEFLLGIEGDARISILRELLAFDFNKRVQLGEQLDWPSYLEKIPEAHEVIDQMFATCAAPLAVGDLTHQDVGVKRIGDYEILDSIGHGGMGTVYRARQLSADRMVAVKVIRSDRLATMAQPDREQFINRFKNEACAAAKLDHPHIVTLYDVGNVDGEPFYSMQLVDGEDLAQLVAKGPLDHHVAATYMQQVASALSAIHASGMLHRDLKPGNIMINRHTQQALVTDFGLARIEHTDSELTQLGDFLGSPAYMSPEQVKDPRQIDRCADVYSMGATLYHLITGRPPFQTVSLLQTLEQVKYLEPVAPRELNPEIHIDLETICMKCLEKEPARRYATAEQLADDLQRFLNDEPIHATPPTPIDRFVRWYPKHAATMLGAYFILTPFTWVLYILASRFTSYGEGLHMTSLVFLPWPIGWMFLGYHLIKYGRVFEVINAISLAFFALLPVFLNNDPQQLILVIGITCCGLILQFGVFWSRRHARQNKVDKKRRSRCR